MSFAVDHGQERDGNNGRKGRRLKREGREGKRKRKKLCSHRSFQKLAPVAETFLNLKPKPKCT